ncbi:hypothetical protein PROFUN_16474, partial [Planoprotostelium fungivorum]
MPSLASASVRQRLLSFRMQCFLPSLYKACSEHTKAYKCFAENLQTDHMKQVFSNNATPTLVHIFFILTLFQILGHPYSTVCSEDPSSISLGNNTPTQHWFVFVFSRSFRFRVRIVHRPLAVGHNSSHIQGNDKGLNQKLDDYPYHPVANHCHLEHSTGFESSTPRHLLLLNKSKCHGFIAPRKYTDEYQFSAPATASVLASKFKLDASTLSEPTTSTGAPPPKEAPPLGLYGALRASQALACIAAATISNTHSFYSFLYSYYIYSRKLEKNYTWLSEGVSQMDPLLNLREDTCKKIKQRMTQVPVLLIEGSPYSGKTSLVSILTMYFKSHNYDCDSFSFLAGGAPWDPSKSYTATKMIHFGSGSSATRLREGLIEFCLGGENLRGGAPWDPSKYPDDSIVIVDEVQKLYHNKDDPFWEWIKRNKTERGTHRILLFAAWGGENLRGEDSSTPLNLSYSAGEDNREVASPIG